MKALHVWERIFHYVKIWLFILAVVFIALGVFSSASLLVVEEGEASLELVTDAVLDATGYESVDPAVAVAYAFNAFAAGFASFSLFLVIGSIVMWALEHIFKMVQVIRKRDAAKCCSCKEEEGDAQVEKIMKWKDFYNEGIITEREFIQKRNEILGLHK